MINPHTADLSKRIPGGNCSSPPAAFAAHVFSGMAEMSVILKIWECGVLPFVLLKRKWPHQRFWVDTLHKPHVIWLDLWCEFDQTDTRVL